MSDTDVPDPEKRRFLALATSLLGVAGAGLVATPLVRSLEPDAGVEAASVTTADLSGIEPGTSITVSWQDKPVIILRRTPQMLATLSDTSRLLDPDCREPQQPPACRNAWRSLDPQWLVLVSVCTHLCCVPILKPRKGEVGPEWNGGFHCPCHGSFYDLSGRVFKEVPAPRNLAVPEYEFSPDKRRVTIRAMPKGAQLC